MPKIKEELTEEDESRRMRRRERNKVAATKCRNKKKAKTVNLMKVRDLIDMIYGIYALSQSFGPLIINRLL